MTLNELFDLAIDRKASEIHLAHGESPRLRVGGELVSLETEAPTDDLLTPEARARLAVVGTAEWTVVHGGFVLAGVAFATAGGDLAATFRLLPKGVPPFERIMEGAEPFFQDLAKRRQGLILVTGPAATGKTTTALALVDRINAERPARILVVSDGPSHVFENRRSLVSHVLVGEGPEGYVRALRLATPAGADVVTTDDLPTYEALREALLLADGGMLVVANLHAASPAQAIERLVGSAGDEAPALRRALADRLVAVTGQRLLPRVGGGRMPIYEWILNGPAVREALLSGADPSVILAEDGGCRTFVAAIRDAYMSGKISLEDAFAATPPEGIEALKAMG